MREAVKPGIPLTASRVISKRYSASARPPCLCGGLPVGRKMTLSSFSSRLAQAAISICLSWMGLKLPPMMPMRSFGTAAPPFPDYPSIIQEKNAADHTKSHARGQKKARGPKAARAVPPFRVT